jgi:hypothetical protein
MYSNSLDTGENGRLNSPQHVRYSNVSTIPKQRNLIYVEAQPDHWKIFAENPTSLPAGTFDIEILFSTGHLAIWIYADTYRNPVLVRMSRISRLAEGFALTKIAPLFMMSA